MSVRTGGKLLFLMLWGEEEDEEDELDETQELQDCQNGVPASLGKTGPPRGPVSQGPLL